MSGARTEDSADAVNPNFLNLSTSRPDVLPQATTFLASSTVGTWMTHSLVFFSASNEESRLHMTQAMMGGSKYTIMCHDMVMMFAPPPLMVETSTTGPGSISR